MILDSRDYQLVVVILSTDKRTNNEYFKFLTKLATVLTCLNLDLVYDDDGKDLHLSLV